MEMATDADPKRVAHLRERIATEPEFVAAINELWWQSVRERCEELRNGDLRHQAIDALDLVIDLLRSDDQGDEQ